MAVESRVGGPMWSACGQQHHDMGTSRGTFSSDTGALGDHAQYLGVSPLSALSRHSSGTN